MQTGTSTEYVLVVDTDSYAGNFERELTAYCTGQIGECEKGSRQAQDFRDFMPWLDNPFDDIVTQRGDDRGTMRPTAIYPTPGRTNNGTGQHSDVTPDNPYKYPAFESVAIFFSEKPTKLMIDIIKDRATEFAENRVVIGKPAPVKVLGFRLITEHTVYHKEEEVI